MINFVDNICSQGVQLIVPLVGLRILLDYCRMLLFNQR